MGKKLLLPGLLDSTLHELDMMMFCHYKAEQIFKFPASWKSLQDTMDLHAEDGCPNVTEEL